MKTIGLHLFVLISLGLPLAAQDYCSLAVRVLAPDGQRVAVAISVQEKNGRVEEGDQEGDDVRFCDLGGLPVKVIVGEKGCNQVVVNDVPVSWNETYLLTVTYDPDPCYRDLPPPPIPICRVVFRVSDAQGKWVQGANIDLAEPMRRRLSTDKYGRASFVSKLNDNVIGSIAGDDHPITFRFTCTRDEPVHEEHLVLESR